MLVEPSLNNFNGFQSVSCLVYKRGDSRKPCLLEYYRKSQKVVGLIINYQNSLILGKVNEIWNWWFFAWIYLRYFFIIKVQSQLANKWLFMQIGWCLNYYKRSSIILVIKYMCHNLLQLNVFVLSCSIPNSIIVTLLFMFALFFLGIVLYYAVDVSVECFPFGL